MPRAVQERRELSSLVVAAITSTSSSIRIESIGRLTLSQLELASTNLSSDRRRPRPATMSTVSLILAIQTHTSRERVFHYHRSIIDLNCPLCSSNMAVLMTHSLHFEREIRRSARSFFFSFSFPVRKHRRQA